MVGFTVLMPENLVSYDDNSNSNKYEPEFVYSIPEFTTPLKLLKLGTGIKKFYVYRGIKKRLRNREKRTCSSILHCTIKLVS